MGTVCLFRVFDRLCVWRLRVSFVSSTYQRAPTMTEVEAAKARERLLERPRKTPSKKPTCAVCEVPFALVNLPLVISYKAVLDLRASYVAAQGVQCALRLAHVTTHTHTQIHSHTHTLTHTRFGAFW